MLSLQVGARYRRGPVGASRRSSVFLTPSLVLSYVPRSPDPVARGAVAQMVERLVRNEEVWGSIPHGSTRMCQSSSLERIMYPRIGLTPKSRFADVSTWPRLSLNAAKAASSYALSARIIRRVNASNGIWPCLRANLPVNSFRRLSAWSSRLVAKNPQKFFPRHARALAVSTQREKPVLSWTARPFTTSALALTRG